MEQSKEQLEKGIKRAKKRLGIIKGVVYLNSAVATSMFGLGMYNLAEGDYRIALLDAGAALFNVYVAYSNHQIVKKNEERIKNEQSQLENLVGEDKPIQ